MIRASERLRMLLRSFVIQAAWNPKGMQNIGMFFAMRPALRTILGGSGDARGAADERHIQFFNTHPYFAPILLGVAARLEEDLAAGRLAEPKHVRLFVTRMSGPFAAVGDALFWETIRPAVALSAVWASLALLGAGRGGEAWVGVVLFLAGFNLLVLPFRLWGVAAGYRHGLGIVEVLKAMRLQETMRRLRKVSLFVLGLFVATALAHPASAVGMVPAVPARTWPLLAGATAAALSLLSARRVSPTLLWYAILGWAVAASFLAGGAA